MNKGSIWLYIKKWFSRFIMSLGVIFLLFLVMSFISITVLFRGGSPSLPDEMVLRIVARDGFYESANPNPLAMFADDAAYGIHDLNHALRLAATDDRVKAVVLSIRDGTYGYAHINELHRAMDIFRESGKPIYAYATSFGGASSGMETYYMAAAADEIWLQPIGVVGITGFFMQVPFFKGLMDKLGIKADILHEGDYKSAPESVTRTSMSESNKEMSKALMGDYYDTFVGDVARYRDRDANSVRRAIDAAPLLGNEAVSQGFVDVIGYKDQLIDLVKNEFGDIPWVDAASYAAQTRKKTETKHTVALITIDGVIAGQGGVMGENSIDLAAIIRNLEIAKQDKNCVGVVLRINSPGGTPEAAEELRRVITAVNAEKPVVVSMGNVAASGGYWIAVNVRRIYAESMTLTGSIGVFGGKVGLSELLDKAGINLDGVKMGKDADIWSLEKTYTPEQRQKIEAILADVYGAFVQRVAYGRGLPLETVKELAKGRVYTGNQALKNGLVDEIGDIETAAAGVRRMAGVSEAAIMTFHEPFDMMDTLLSLIKQAGMVLTSGVWSPNWVIETVAIR